MSRRDVSAGPVVIAIDPRKRSWTAVAVNGSLQVEASVRVEADRDGYRELRRFAGRWPGARWAIEGAGGLGAPLATRLLADGLAVLDVPAKLAARVRALSTGHGRKEALRCLKRGLSDVVYRQLVCGAEAVGPGGHPGATLQSSAAGPTPTADSSDKSLPGPAATQPTTAGSSRC